MNSRRKRTVHSLVAACAVALAAAGAASVSGPDRPGAGRGGVVVAAFAADPKDLKDPDVKVRLAAVRELAEGRTEEAETLLLTALADKDLEVVEVAIRGLGTKSGDAAVKALAKLCTDAPARRLRMVAGRTTAAHPRRADVTALLAKTGQGSLLAACEAASAVSDQSEDANVAKLLDRGLAAKKDPAVRAAAARLLGALPAEERAKRLESLVDDDDTAVACAAADAVRFRPDDATTPLLLRLLARAKPPLAEGTDRRLRAAFVSAVAAKGTAEAASALARTVNEALPAATTPESAWRLTRLLGELAELPDDRVSKPTLFAGLDAVTKHGSPKVRAAVAWSAERIGGAAALDLVLGMAKTDADARVRLIALRAATTLAPAETSDPVFRLLADRIDADESPLVREEAAVALGRRGLVGAVPSLQKAVVRAIEKKDHSEWALGTCALVSLGKTRDPAAVPVLVSAWEYAKDWRLRASAIIGLARVQQRDAIPHVIEAMGEKDPQVRATAYEHLRRLTNDSVGETQAAWKTWWEKNGPSYAWVDREEEAKRAKKYGYATDVSGVYEGLDVIVLDTRVGGDRIQEVLADDALKIEHRLTRAGSVPKDGIHPLALFISNCPGELNPDDEEPVAWFVRAGGYLFNSCWALNKTIERVYPDVLRKAPIKHQVIDNVTAEPCRLGSPFIEGVFRDLVRPIYCLEGAHLIEVLDPERAEVLMDSPWTEEKYGYGNMVAWFRAGHGLVLDSANHFEEQGLAKAAVKTPEERVAFAVDHMGLSWEDVRKVDAKAWKTPQDAGRAAKDLSCFRLITNFVRLKRKSQE